MNSNQFLNSISNKTGVDKAEVENVLNYMFKNMYLTLAQENTLSVYSFGIFSLRQKQGWNMYNPKTKDIKVVPPKEDLVFHVSPAFKDKCNNNE
jgi:nucleoid DNA-binding protein